MILFGRLALCAIALTLYSAGARSQTQPDQTPTLEQALGAEVDRFVEADRVAPPAPCEVLFVGSSSIANWRETLAADMAPMPVIDRGFGGSHIEYVNRWFDKIVAPYRPRAIVFYAGENDIDAGKSVARVVDDTGVNFVASGDFTGTMTSLCRADDDGTNQFSACGHED